MSARESLPHIMRASPYLSESKVVEHAANVVNNRGVIVLPTDTVYGIGGRMDCRKTVERIYKAKGRAEQNPLVVVLPDAASLPTLIAGDTLVATKLAEAFWPGALTIVFAKSSAVPDWVTSGASTVGVRVPEMPLTQAILAKCESPLVLTSANRSGEPPVAAVNMIPPDVLNHVDLVVDAGKCPGAVASTVVDVTASPPLILREGPITAEQIQAVIGGSVRTL